MGYANLSLPVHTAQKVRLVTQTRDQNHFTISEVAADWHELMISQRTMRPSIAHATEQLDPRCSTQTYHRLNQVAHKWLVAHATLSLHPVARNLLLIPHHTEGRRLSCPEHAVSLQLSKDAHHVIQYLQCKLVSG